MIAVSALPPNKIDTLSNDHKPLSIEKIVGGHHIKIDKVPYQLSLQYREEHNCGASLITQSFAITAAHCVHRINPTSLSVRAGSSIIEQDGVVVQIKATHPHPKFNPDTYDYDIAVLEFSTNIEFNPKIQPIRLPDQNYVVKTGRMANVTGWGDTNENGDPSKDLMLIEIPLIDQQDCRKYHKAEEITERMFCAGVENGGKDACQGDSGGPLAVNGELIGVVSWGIGCARPKSPGVYTYVAKMRDFIDSIIK